MTLPELAHRMAERFELPAPVFEVACFGGGHINETYLVTAGDRFLLQRINQRVFRRPDQVMHNMALVTEHMRTALRLAGVQDVDRRVVRLVPARAGSFATVDDEGEWWRMMRYVDGSRSFDSPPGARQAHLAARTFGDFQRLLADYAGPALFETIPGFHDTPERYDAFERAVAENNRGRASAVEKDIAHLRSHAGLATMLSEAHRAGDLPTRIVHNDAKLSNVLFDVHTNEALCVVDLDTVMPGLSLFDYGDMVRSMSASGAEDERNLSEVYVDPALLEAITSGYLEAMGDRLTPQEQKLLPAAARSITYEQALRFMTDYLDGDVYYRTERPEQNLDRCRVQLALLDDLVMREW